MTSSTSSSKGAGRLLLNIALLAMIIIVISQTVLIILPFSWGERPFNSQFTQYLASQERYDTLFVGSSRTYRHVDPALFDRQIMGSKPGSEPARSFNMGVAASTFPKTYGTVREILSQNSGGLKTIFFEMTPASTGWVPPENRHTRRQIYWYELDSLRYYLRSIWQSDMVLEEKLLLSGLHTAFMIEKNLNFGMGLDIVKHFLVPRSSEMRYLGQGRDGFYPLEEAVTVEDSATIRDLEGRRDILLADPGYLETLAESSRSVFNDPSSLAGPPLPYLSRLEEMQALAAEQGVEIIFVLPPRMTDQAYRSLLPIFYALPPEQRIDLANPDKYPEFYNLEYSFDRTHFNYQGAAEFTKALARELEGLGE